jgi:glucose/arabinose dehydrogenase
MRGSDAFRTGAVLALLFVAACVDEDPQQPATGGLMPAHAVVAPPGASVAVQVQVPASMRTAPFDVTRTLTVPPDFTVAVYARVPGARFLAVTPDGNLLVSHPAGGRVRLIRPNPGGDPLISDFATGLRRPHDIVFHDLNGVTYLYVAETNQIDRYLYTPGDLTAQQRQVVVTGLPDASSPGLGGSYGHELKNIALDANHKLYVSIASTCNACTSDTQSNPVRASIYQYNADGTGGRLFARGLRNAEGLALLNGSLWVAVNNRDNIAYPFHNDWTGDGTDDYGKVMQSYVDNHPPDEFTSVRDGGNYGWPFCNPNPDTPAGYDLMPFDRDVQFNASGSALDCNTADRIVQGIQAHSAPLGFSFLNGTAFPSAYQSGAALAYHGSWNRTQKTGYKVAHFPFDMTTQQAGDQIDLVTGWATSSSSWGRPVDVAVDGQGTLLISDDQAGAIYKLAYTPAPPPPPPPPVNGIYEAEQGTLSGAVVATQYSGFRGSGYVDFISDSGAYLELDVSVATAGAYKLWFRYALRSGNVPLELRVNGQVVAPNLAFKSSGNWTRWRGVTRVVTLNAGSNTVRLTTIGSNGPNLDRMTVEQ